MTTAIKLSLSNYALILSSIQEARDPGLCTYERNGKPSCIVGVLGHKLGAPIETLKAWDRVRAGGNPSGITHILQHQEGARELFKDFPEDMLYQLQCGWDMTHSAVNYTSDVDALRKVCEDIAASWKPE